MNNKLDLLKYRQYIRERKDKEHTPDPKALHSHFNFRPRQATLSQITLRCKTHHEALQSIQDSPKLSTNRNRSGHEQESDFRKLSTAEYTPKQLKKRRKPTHPDLSRKLKDITNHK